MLLANSWQQYKANFKTALVFALLLVFILPLSSFENVFASSGTIFLDYNLATADMASLAALVGLIALSMLFYSFFISILVLGVRKNLSKIKLHFYLHEMMQRFTLKVFIFYLMYSLALFLLPVLLISLAVPIDVIALLLLLISVSVLFVPQSIIIDEEDPLHALSNNFEFIAKNKRATLTILVVGAFLLALLMLVEFAIDQFALVGSLASLLIVLVFILPFLEIMKTYLYMMKFDLIKSHEAAQHSKPRSPKPEPGSLAAA